MTGLPDLIATIACIGLALGACIAVYVWWPRVARDIRRDRARERAEETSERLSVEEHAVTTIHGAEPFMRHK